MWFSMDVLRARKGDCLMVHYGSSNDPHLIMIDGGPSNVYRPHLKPRIDELRRIRSLADDQPLPVDVLMVSHVDDDHIKGILDLTRDLRDLKTNRSPLFLDVRALWHNTFDDTLESTPRILSAMAGFGTAAVTGELADTGDFDMDTAKVLASISQGRDLRDDAKFLGWKTNRGFTSKLILASDDSPQVALPGGLKVTVIGPMKAELQALQTAHDKWVEDNQDKIDSGSAEAAFKDKSIPNLSSLVFLFEYRGKTMLLTGDARGDKIIEGLELAGILQDDETLHVDLLKIPHHGSSNNLETSFFERITADHYVFSGNGEHGNPERESLQMLREARADNEFLMHFTYPIAEIDDERKQEWTKQRTKEVDSGGEAREKWSRSKHSLAAFFEENSGLAQSVRIVSPHSPHWVDLLDAVIY